MGLLLVSASCTNLCILCTMLCSMYVFAPHSGGSPGAVFLQVLERLCGVGGACFPNHAYGSCSNLQAGSQTPRCTRFGALIYF